MDQRFREIVGLGLKFIEQPRVLDGDDGLVRKTLLKREFLGGERNGPVAVDDEDTDRLALASKRRAGHGAGARRARGRQSGPVGDLWIDIVDVGNVNLPVFEQDRAGHVMPANPDWSRCSRSAILRLRSVTTFWGSAVIY